VTVFSSVTHCMIFQEFSDIASCSQSGKRGS
jgi:hypothetical protein